MKEGQIISRLNRPVTPLVVICLFLSFTEIALSVIVTKTSGKLQIALAVFAVIYTVGIAIAFFLILWKKPHHFYSPAEYGGNVSPGEFAEMVYRTQRQAAQTADVVKRLDTELQEVKKKVIEIDRIQISEGRTLIVQEERYQLPSSEVKSGVKDAE